VFRQVMFGDCNLVCILYCGCFNLLRDVWVSVCGGLLVICILVFTEFCTVCIVFLYCFVYMYLFLMVLFVQSGSNMTGTDLCVNKPHCAAAVRP
jgi:hypothetical protein